MVTLGKVHKGDQGTEFQLLVNDTALDDTNSVVDLSGVTTMEMIFTDPDGTESTETASIANPPGTDGIIKFVTTDTTTISVAGWWYYRAKLTFTSGNIFQSNDAEFEVLGSQD